MPNTKPSTVGNYIKSAPKIAQRKLREMRSILKEVAPNATETIKWGSPVFVEKRILFAYSAFKAHLNFMPTRSALVPFKKILAGRNREEIGRNSKEETKEEIGDVFNITT